MLLYVPIKVFFTAELSVTLKMSFFGVTVVDIMVVGAVVGSSVVTNVPEEAVELRVCEGVVIVGELLCAEG